MARFNAHSPRQRSRPMWPPLGAAALVATLLVVSGCGGPNLTGLNYVVAGMLPQDYAAHGVNKGRAQEAGAVHLEGEIGPGALWTIDQPDTWNGDLVVYLHGYLDPALPVLEPGAQPGFAPIRDALLTRGFSVVASSYSTNGYAVKEGMEQSHQLSGLFASRVSQPKRTFLLGQSMGGLIGLLLTQKFPTQYNGTLLVCGVVGGSDDEVQYLGDIRVLFDAVYPGVLGGDLEHPPVITDVNAQVIGPVLAAVGGNPQGLGIIQLLARHPLAGANSQEVVTSLLSALIFGLEGGGDLLDRAHGHTFFDNADWRYTSPALPAALLDDINARVVRYRVDPAALAFLQQYGEPSGAIRVPLISMYTSRDPVVPSFHEDLLAQASAGPMLVQRQTQRFGHVNFSVDELMSNFDDLVAWVTSGQRPI